MYKVTATGGLMFVFYMHQDQDHAVPGFIGGASYGFTVDVDIVYAGEGGLFKRSPSLGVQPP